MEGYDLNKLLETMAGLTERFQQQQTLFDKYFGQANDQSRVAQQQYMDMYKQQQNWQSQAQKRINPLQTILGDMFSQMPMGAKRGYDAGQSFGVGRTVQKYLGGALRAPMNAVGVNPFNNPIMESGQGAQNPMGQGQNWDFSRWFSGRQ